MKIRLEGAGGRFEITVSHVEGGASAFAVLERWNEGWHLQTNTAPRPYWVGHYALHVHAAIGKALELMGATIRGQSKSARNRRLREVE